MCGGERKEEVCIVGEFKERLRSFEEEALSILLFFLLNEMKCESLCVVSMYVFGWNVNEDDNAI